MEKNVGMKRSGKKPKSLKGVWFKLIRYCKKYYLALGIAVLCAIVGTVFTLVGPDKLSDMTKVITDGLATGIDMDKIRKIGFTLVGFYICGAILSMIQQLVTVHVTQNVAKKLRGDISEKINRLPMSYYNKTSTGDVLSCVTNDVDMIAQSLNQSVGNLIHAITLFLGSLIMMLATNVIMALTAVVATAMDSR